MLDYQLEKYRDFKGYIDEYLNAEIPQEEILSILGSLEVLWEYRHAALFKNLESDPVLLQEQASLIKMLRSATKCFEDARDAVEEAIIEDRLDEIDEALEVFKEGNRLLMKAHYQLEEHLERGGFSGSM